MSWPLGFCCASGPGGAEQPCPDESSWSPAGFRALEGGRKPGALHTSPALWLNAAWFDFSFLLFVSGFFLYPYHSKVKFLFLSS